MGIQTSSPSSLPSSTSPSLLPSPSLFLLVLAVLVLTDDLPIHKNVCERNTRAVVCAERPFRSEEERRGLWARGRGCSGRRGYPCSDRLHADPRNHGSVVAAQPRRREHQRRAEELPEARELRPQVLVARDTPRDNHLRDGQLQVIPAVDEGPWMKEVWVEQEMLKDANG